MWSGISVREVPGHHLVQPSNTPSRPIVSRRVNLLTATTTLATQSVTTLAASHVLTFSGTGSVTLSGAATGTYSAGTHTITATAGTLTVTVSGSVTNADLRLSIDANLPPYQRVTSPTDYDEVGFPAYVKFDGVDDWLESGVVDMTSTDAAHTFSETDGWYAMWASGLAIRVGVLLVVLGMLWRRKRCGSWLGATDWGDLR